MCKCRKCGAKIEQSSRFCQSCGTKIKQPLNETQKKKYEILIYVITGIFVLVIGVGIGFLLGKTIDKEKQTDEIIVDSQNESTIGINDDDNAISSDSNDGDFESVTENVAEDVKEDNNKEEKSGDDDNIVPKNDLGSYNYVSIGQELNPKYDTLFENYQEIFRSMNNFDNVEGWIEGDSQIIRDFNYGGIHFAKAKPRDVRIICDISFEGQRLDKVTKAKYTEDFSSTSAAEIISVDACYLEYGNVVKFTKEYLLTLEPGYYEFVLYLSGDRDSTWPINVVIHDEAEPIVNYRLNITQPRGFYSTESKNDVLFYLNGSTSPIDEIILEGSVLDKNDYELVCDGYGIILHPEFLEKYSDRPYIELTIRTKADLSCTVKIGFLNHA